MAPSVGSLQGACGFAVRCWVVAVGAFYAPRRWPPNPSGPSEARVESIQVGFCTGLSCGRGPVPRRAALSGASGGRDAKPASPGHCR